MKKHYLDLRPCRYDLYIYSHPDTNQYVSTPHDDYHPNIDWSDFYDKYLEFAYSKHIGFNEDARHKNQIIFYAWCIRDNCSL